MIWAFWAVAVIVFVFSFVLLVGAPFVPTLKKQTREALDLLDLKRGQILLELGSGDGRILRAAAERGIKAVGYEINPFLYIYSKFRCRKYRQLATVLFGNYWNKPLPPADGIYVFLLDRFMPKLSTKITQEITKPIKVVSYAFEFPDHKAVKARAGMLLYEFQPTQPSLTKKPLRGA
jgi:hypothetical protein